MFSSVTAGNRNNIYFLDKWSGFLGQFNVIGLYNKRKWPQHPVLIPVKKFRQIKISKDITICKKRKKMDGINEKQEQKDAAVKSGASSGSAGDPAHGSDTNMGWKLPDKNHYYSIELERKMHILLWECLCKGNTLYQPFFSKKKIKSLILKGKFCIMFHFPYPTLKLTRW